MITIPEEKASPLDAEALHDAGVAPGVEGGAGGDLLEEFDADASGA